MGNLHESIADTIGKTPLVRVRTLSDPGAKIYAKLEFFNPIASVKDRIGVAMVEALQEAIARYGCPSIFKGTGGTVIFTSVVPPAK